jgi:hypothetical protein
MFTTTYITSNKIHTYETLKKHCKINCKEDKQENHFRSIIHPIVLDPHLPGHGVGVGSTCGGHHNVVMETVVGFPNLLPFLYANQRGRLVRPASTASGSIIAGLKRKVCADRKSRKGGQRTSIIGFRTGSRREFTIRRLDATFIPLPIAFTNLNSYNQQKVQ